MRREKLKRFFFIKELFLSSLSLFLGFYPAFAQERANLWGLVVDSDRKPLLGVKVSLSKIGGEEKFVLSSDENGHFISCSIPLGHYSLSFEYQSKKIPHPRLISFEPSQTVYLNVIFVPGTVKDSPKIELITLYSLDYEYQTTLGSERLRAMPTPHNVWSLIENQDLSSTTNRIDVGGLWASVPALFSSRGACSWTQNNYYLNGMEVTDPYFGGLPLFYPELNTLSFTQLINADLPPQTQSPGAYLNLITKEGATEYHGTASFFLTHRVLQSKNITPHLEKEGLKDTHSFNHFLEGNFSLSGPLLSRKFFFFTSLSSFSLSRDIAEFPEEDKAFFVSGFLSLSYSFAQNNLRLIWTGQSISHPSYGAGRKIPFSSTLDRKDLYHIFQAIWELNLSQAHQLKLGFLYNQGRTICDFQEGISSLHSLEILKNLPSGPAPLASESKRENLSFLIAGKTFFLASSNLNHLFHYGLSLRYCDSRIEEKIIQNLHLRFFEGKPLEVVKFNSPSQHQESAFHLNLYAQDTLSFPSLLSISFDLHFRASQGWIPEEGSHETQTEGFELLSQEKTRIIWHNLSPRLGILWPFGSSKQWAMKLSLARYFFNLPLSYLSFGNPGAIGGLVYLWNDENKDNLFQENERGKLIRREGPFFAKIDKSLRSPRVDELAISFHHNFGPQWHLMLGFFMRETRNLIETVNIGLTPSSFSEVEIFDIGDDMVPGTHDDLTFTVFNQKEETLGKDFFLLTNDGEEGRVTRYHGADLTLVKKYSEKFNFFLSFTATKAVGKTSPGNTEWENDDGVIGALFDNPNTLINSKGRLRFDRAYTFRSGLEFSLPLGIKAGFILKYYDGQPFTRKIIVRGMNQGPFYIQAFPRGVARYEYNMTFDVRMEKTFLLEKRKIKIIVDGFNVLNRALATEENEWTGPEFPLRFATEVQSPRVFRLGLRLEF